VAIGPLSRDDITGALMDGKGRRVGAGAEGRSVQRRHRSHERRTQPGCRPDAQMPAANFLCMQQPPGVLCLLARGRFLCESVPAQFSIFQRRSYTMAKKAKKKKAKKKK
jgi:hypothetical protein